MSRSTPVTTPKPLSTPLVDAYLALLGMSQPVEVDEASLRKLHRRHLQHVPFENLDIHLGGEISLDPARIATKFTERRRGGICYELNGGFASLLASLGFDVVLAEARVKELDGTLGIRFDHLCLIVGLDGQWLCDVGFGSLFDEPLRLVSDVWQADIGGEFTLTARPDGWWDLLDRTGFRYCFNPTPRRLAEFEPGRLHHTTSPQSDFTTKTVTTRRTANGRVTIRNVHTVETIDGTKHEADVDGVELEHLYRRWFGLELEPTEITTLLRISGVEVD